MALPDLPPGRRILIVTGHYGSGKTEFAVSLAMLLARENRTGFPRLALCDLDIVNPYFRSRERKELLESAGVKVYGGMFGKGATAEIPELAASVRAPLEDPGCFTIVDAGGNDSGALVLNQFSDLFTREARFTAAVVNASRPETRDPDGALAHIRSIERATGLGIDGLVSNTHMLMETKPADIVRGYALCSGLGGLLKKPVIAVAYPEKLVGASALSGISAPLVPLGMYMRETWLDR